jgi:hypothetical protein
LARTARVRLRERVAAMETAAGRMVAEAEAEYWTELAALDIPEPALYRRRSRVCRISGRRSSCPRS